MLYTTPDAIDEIAEAHIGQLDIADLVYKDFQNIPLSKLYSQKENVKLILSARSNGTHKGDSNCDAGGMNVDSHAGRKQLNVADYLSRIAIDKPKVVIAMADEVSFTILNTILSMSPH